MRIQLTVRRAGSAVPARVVVVECAPGTRAGELARALGAPGLSVAGRPVPDTALVGTPPLLAEPSCSSADRRPPPRPSSPWS